MKPTLTRDDLVKIYGVSHSFLGYLLREKKIPLPVQISEEPMWYPDEVQNSLPKIKQFLDRRSKAN